MRQVPHLISNSMSDSSPRFELSARNSRSHRAPEELAPSRRELETVLALAENRPLSSEQLDVAERLQRDRSARRVLARHRRVAGALRGGGPAVPPVLAARLAAQTPRSADRRPRPLASGSSPIKLIGAAAAVFAAVVLVGTVIAGWSSGGPSPRPTAAQISAAWMLPATGRTVAADPAHPADLDISFHGIVYPNFYDREGWHPVAARYDRIAGVPAATVFYQTGRRRAAYTVVPVTGLAVPADATRLHVAGLSLTEFRSGDRWIVTFQRNGNTCVLTASAPRERRWLIALATWGDGPTTTPARRSTIG